MPPNGVDAAKAPTPKVEVPDCGAPNGVEVDEAVFPKDPPNEVDVEDAAPKGACAAWGAPKGVEVNGGEPKGV